MEVRDLPGKVMTLVLLLALAWPATAATDISAHEARIRELEAKVARLEALLDPPMSEPDHPTLHAETDIKVGGFVKIDGLISDYSNALTRGAGEDIFIPSTISTTGDPPDTRLNLHAKETRFWLKSLTPTERGDITTHFEIDFMLGQQGDERIANSYSLRIRHASVNWDRWTVGQTWTNFFNTTVLPDYLDFVGPVGATFARQPQVRYTAPTATGSWSFSLENPETTLTPYGGGPRIDADDSSAPDLIVRRNWTGDWGNISVAGLLRELKINEADRDDSEVGGAISVAGKFKLSEGDDIRWQMIYGNALGRYLGLNSYNVGTLDATNNIVLTRQYGVLVAYKHLWTHRLQSSLGASFSGAANETATSGFAVPRNYQSAHANIVWSPIERMRIGAEYIWGRREDESGDDGTLNRLLLSAEYLY